MSTRLKCTIMIVFLVLVSPALACAALISQLYHGTPVVYDDSTGFYWYSDVPSLGGYYADTMSGIASIYNDGSIGPWHLATLPEFTTLTSDVYFNRAFIGLPPFRFTSIRMVDLDGVPGLDYAIGFVTGRLSDGDDTDGTTYEMEVLTQSAFLTVGEPLQWSLSGLSTVYGPSTVAHSSFSPGAWVVAHSLPAAVPLPPTLLLMVSGLVGCAGIKRWFRR